MQGHETCFGAGPHQREDENDCAHARCARASDRLERVSAFGAREQPEREQQRESSAGRHDEIDEGSAPVFTGTVVADHERPGCERHEFPADEE